MKANDVRRLIAERRQQQQQPLPLDKPLVVGVPLPSDAEMMRYDIKRALDLLNTCSHLLDYMANTDILRRISKRERMAMGVLADRVNSFIDDVEPTYED